MSKVLLETDSGNTYIVAQSMDVEIIHRNIDRGDKYFTDEEIKEVMNDGPGPLKDEGFTDEEYKSNFNESLGDK